MGDVNDKVFQPSGYINVRKIISS